MPNKRYVEDEDGGGLPGQVKGKKGEAASFKPLGGDKDDEQANLNKTGVKMPHDNEKKL